MVRHGNRQPAPGCISMEEAILLSRALNGAPTGPGTGITTGARQQQPPSFNIQPQHNFNNIPSTSQNIPGVNFLGDGSPGRRFEDRFRSAAGPQPIPQQGGAWQQQGGAWQQPGGAWQQPGGFNGVIPGSLNGAQSVPPGFSDPTVDTQFRNTGFGVDGGHNTIHSHVDRGNALRGSRSSSLNINTNPWNANSRGGRNSQVTSGNGFPGETQTLINIPSNTERVGQSEARVSTIMNDTVGFYYMFYHPSSSTRTRVDITKNGLCTRYDIPPDTSACEIVCRSDAECGGNFKCCPTGCTLGCMAPYLETAQPQQQLPQQPQTIPSRGPTPAPPVSGGNSRCEPSCTSSSECGRQYCFFKIGCPGSVCQDI